MPTISDCRLLSVILTQKTIEPELEKWVREGRVLPAEKSGFVALFAGMSEDFEISFAAPSGDVKQSGGQFLKSFLSKLTISLGAQLAALPAGTAVNARGLIATNPADNDFLGVTLQPVEISAVRDVAVVYSDVAIGVAGAVFPRGQALTVGANGVLVPVAAGQFIVGLALQAATAIGNPVQFLIRQNKQ